MDACNLVPISNELGIQIGLRIKEEPLEDENIFMVNASTPPEYDPKITIKNEINDEQNYTLSSELPINFLEPQTNLIESHSDTSPICQLSALPIVPEPLSTSHEPLSTSREPLSTSHEPLSTSREQLPESLPAVSETISAFPESLPVVSETISTFPEPFPVISETIPTFPESAFTQSPPKAPKFFPESEKPKHISICSGFVKLECLQLLPSRGLKVKNKSLCNFKCCVHVDDSQNNALNKYGSALYLLQRIKKEKIEEPHGYIYQNFDSYSLVKREKLDDTDDLNYQNYGDSQTNNEPCNYKKRKSNPKYDDDNKTFHCPICTSKFKAKYYLDIHMRAHSEHRPFACPLCPATFKFNGHLTTHVNAHNKFQSSPTVYETIPSKSTSKTSEMSQQVSGKLNVFKCSICPSVFRSKKSLSNHKRSHSEGYVRQHKCPSCKAVFGLKSMWNLHMKTHLAGRPYHCPHCPAIFKYSNNLKMHMKSHETNKPQLPTSSTNYERLKHLARKPDLPYKCSTCPAKFASKNALTNHKRFAHSGAGSQQCPICPSSFAVKATLHDHMSIHDEFKTKWGLRIHAKEVHDKTSFASNLSLRFVPNNSQGSQVHEEALQTSNSITSGSEPHRSLQLQNGDSKTFQCPLCPSKFRTNCNLACHMRCHKKKQPNATKLSLITKYKLKNNLVKPFVCPTCPAKFTMKHAFIVHVKYAHSGLGLHACPTCPSSFKCPMNLKKHIKNIHSDTHLINSSDSNADSGPRIHDKEGQKEVVENSRQNLQEMTTNRRRRLKNSTQNTDGQKPFRCTVCPLQFQYRSSFQTHLLSHSDYRPYQCPHCPSKFKQKQHLVKHFDTHPGIQRTHIPTEPGLVKLNGNSQNRWKSLALKPHKCPKCPVKFRHRSHLTNHLKCHFREGTHKCPVCPCRYRSKHNLDKHISINHGRSKIQIPASSSNIQDQVPDHLREPEVQDQVQSQVQPQVQNQIQERVLFQCPNCPSKFESEIILGSHMQQCRKTYQCPICPNKFKYISKLMNHLERHEETKPHKCRICFAKFSTKQSLNDHMRIHNNSGSN